MPGPDGVDAVLGAEDDAPPARTQDRHALRTCGGAGGGQNHIDDGGKAWVRSGEPDRFYLVQSTQSGGALALIGGHACYPAPIRAAVLNPHRPTTVIRVTGCARPLIQIDRRAMSDHQVARLAGGSTGLAFGGPSDPTTGTGIPLQ